MFAHQVIDDINKYYQWVKMSNKDYDKVYLSTQLHCAQEIKNCQHFHLSNITGLLETGKRYVGKPLFYDDLSDVRLPYDKCWFDYEINDSSVSVERRASKRGLLVLAKKQDMILVVPFWYRDQMKKWFGNTQGYMFSVGKKFADRDDLVSTDVYQKLTNIMPVPLFQNGKPDFEMLKDDQEDLSILNIALMLLSCKNITTETNKPPEKLNQKRIKSNRQPLFSYHTLLIRPFGKKQESIQKDLWNNRIHLQRGHFKTYTPDKPLFGHITGRFWWQAHVRGQNKDGIVIKDYVVQPDQTPKDPKCNPNTSETP